VSRPFPAHRTPRWAAGPGRVSRRVRVALSAAVLAGLALPAYAAPSSGGDGAGPTVRAAGADASVRLDPRHRSGGVVPQNFVGLSVEWSLVERYMGPSARPAFANLLGNLGTGVLRIGGSSQDVMPFEPGSPNTNRVITTEDLGFIRATLDRTNSGDAAGARPPWGVVLGTAMAPPSDKRPFVSPEHARTFVTQGVAPAFPGDAARAVVGIELGNEPDLSYGTSRYAGYLQDLRTYSAPAVTGPFPVIAPNTSEDILPWERIAAGPTRYFWNWPEILDTFAPQALARPGEFGAYASDHFYPLARTCSDKTPYRCPSIPALLSEQHLDSLEYEVYTHAGQARQRELGYRLEETNTAAGRGADGVSNVAASATYALDMLFTARCPQPPDAPSANADCGTGALGVNLHNAEVRAFFAPEEGNAYYNAVNYDPSPAMGAPSAAPEYYALLLFAQLAQGTTGLRPVPVTTSDASTGLVKGWQVQGDAAERRLFLINKSDHPVTVAVAAPASSALVDRMTPYDPTGAGRTLDAAQVRIDGRQVAADGTWPGLRPSEQLITGGQLRVTLGAGEAAVVSVHRKA